MHENKANGRKVQNNNSNNPDSHNKKYILRMYTTVDTLSKSCNFQSDTNINTTYATTTNKSATRDVRMNARVYAIESVGNSLSRFIPF